MMSLYLDDALDEDDKNRFENYLAENPDVAAELRAWKKQQQLLRSKQGIRPNEWFWQKLSVRLGQREKKAENIFPFSKKYVPLAAALTVLVALLGGIAVFQQRTLLTSFFSEKQQQVQQIYEGSVLPGKLLPLFTNLNKDQVLQFALFGTLPVDAQAKTALRVDESKEKGTRIEFASNETEHYPQLTVKKFCDEIGATSDEHRSVDSILSAARDKIQASVFLGENRSLAVHADLPMMNRTMMSNIAASLDQPQRMKFKKFLAVSGSPYTFVIPPSLPGHAPAPVRRMPPHPGMEQFVLITPDSCTIAHLKIDLQQVMRSQDLSVQEVRTMNERAHALIREFAQHARRPIAPNSPLSVFSGSNYLSIKVEENALEAPPGEMPFEVVARAPRAVQFQYEMHQTPGMPKFFNGDSEASDRFFQNTPPPGVWNEGAPQSRNIDLDSVISAPRDRKSRPHSDQSKKRYKSPFEL